MHISFSPQRRDDTLVASKSGDVLTINGDAVDLSVIPDGASLPAEAVDCEFVAGIIERVGGDLHITLLLPHGPNPEPWQAFPDPIADVADGPIELPVDTVIEVVEQKIVGGTSVTTTTRRWHQPDEVDVVFVADPEPKEPANGND